MDESNREDAIDLGAWMGRKQAFSGMAGRCSAADAHCLLNMKQEKVHKPSGLSWDEFCQQKLGISRSLADRTIRLLQEFGEPYFYLNGLLQITPEDYRLIAGSVSGDGVQYAGEAIAIAPQNAVKLAAAVENLKQSARLALPAPETKVKQSKDPVWAATKRLQSVVGDLEKLLADGLGNHDRATLMSVLGGCYQRLGQLDRSLR